MRVQIDVGLPSAADSLSPCASITLALMVTLVLATGPSEGSRVALTGEMIIGRDEADLSLDDPQVSRRHAAIRPGAGGAYREAEIVDLGSTNGTFVDGVRITGTVLLTDGARVDVGDTTILVEIVAVDRGVTRVRTSPGTSDHETRQDSPPAHDE